jgi:hypothetical protein
VVLVLPGHAPVLQPLEERRASDAQLPRHTLAVVVELPERGLDDLPLGQLEQLLQLAPGDVLSRDPVALLLPGRWVGVEGEIGLVDQRPTAQEQGAVDDVAQLADVPRPEVGLQSGQRRRSQAHVCPAGETG